MPFQWMPTYVGMTEFSRTKNNEKCGEYGKLFAFAQVFPREWDSSIKDKKYKWLQTEFGVPRIRQNSCL